MRGFKVVFCQMAGHGKLVNEDALFNGEAVRQVLTHKTREVFADAPEVRLAVADGVFASPAPHRVSRYWMNLFAERGTASARFLRENHPAFCDSFPPSYFGSATTFAAVCLQSDGRGRICNVGDSRIYHIDNTGKWTQISHDHTVLAEMIARGEIPANGDYAGIYQSLAHCLVVDPEDEDFHVHSDDINLQIGESVLLCTDGLSDALPHRQLESIWQAHENLQDKVESLRLAVRNAPMHDDCSIVCATYQGKIVRYDPDDDFGKLLGLY